MPGRLFFAGDSPTWGGGIAFYDPDAAGTVYARAYRITAEQFSDLAAQEMRRDPGVELDLSQVLAQRRHAYGPGRYETLYLVGELDDLPVLTFTAPEGHGLRPNPPAPAYLATIRRGLRECHGLSRGRDRRLSRRRRRVTPDPSRPLPCQHAFHRPSFFFCAEAWAFAITGQYVTFGQTRIARPWPRTTRS